MDSDRQLRFSVGNRRRLAGDYPWSGPGKELFPGSHAVGKNDLRKVIGRLKEPLLKPDKEEHYGYVPNVLYSCGAMVVNRTLILPYAMGDLITSFARIEIDEILKQKI